MHEPHQQNHGRVRLRSQKTKHIAQRDFSVEMPSTSRESRVPLRGPETIQHAHQKNKPVINNPPREEDWQDIYKLRSSIERFFGHAKVHHGLVPEASVPASVSPLRTSPKCVNGHQVKNSTPTSTPIQQGDRLRL